MSHTPRVLGDELPATAPRDGSLPPGAVRLRGVSRSFRITHERNLTLKETLVRGRRARFTELWALLDVDLDVAPGETLGIVGENGAGKSTLLKLIAGIVPPQSGSVESRGNVASMLELGSGFHPDFTGRENVYMNGAILGLSAAQIDDRFDEIVAFAEVGEFIDMPVRTYSSGMAMRLAFAISSHVDPDILLLDEVLAVGDEAFQRKCVGRMFEYKRRGGTLLFVSHDAASIERICDRAILLEGGRIVADGATADVLNTYHRQLTRSTSNRPRDVPPPDDETQKPAVREWGTGKVKITDVRLLGADGEAQAFVNGDRLGIRYTVDATEAVTGPCFGVSIWTVDGQLVWGTNTRLEAFGTRVIDGHHQVTFWINELPLHEGSFTVQVAVVSDDGSEVFHWIDAAVRFDVYQQASGVGIVAIRGQWSLDDVAESR